jgi:hypothetical protein
MNDFTVILMAILIGAMTWGCINVGSGSIYAPWADSASTNGSAGSQIQVADEQAPHNETRAEGENSYLTYDNEVGKAISPSKQGDQGAITQSQLTEQSTNTATDGDDQVDKQLSLKADVAAGQGVSTDETTDTNNTVVDGAGGEE